MVLVLALVVGVVYVIMSIVVPELINTILSVIKAIPAALQRLDELIEPYGFSVSQMLSASFTVPSVSDVDAKIADMVNLLLKGAAFSTTVIGTVYQNVLSFFFTVMFTIYFLSSKERLRSQVKNLMRAYLKPRWVEKALSVADLSQRTFSSFITGQCLEACILGGMFFVTMTLLGMPYVLLISVFIAVTALIPVIGAWMGCIVGAILILVNNPLAGAGLCRAVSGPAADRGQPHLPPRHGQRHRPAVHLGALRGAAGRRPDGHSGHAAVHPAHLGVLHAPA